MSNSAFLSSSNSHSYLNHTYEMYRYLDFAQRFKALIAEKTHELGKKPTQAELAKEFDCDQSFISQMATGKKLPSTDMAITMCDYFNCRMDWLLRGVGDKRPDEKKDVYELIDLTQLTQDQKTTLKALIRSFSVSNN